MKSPDWKKGDLDLIKEMLREGEARLSAQVQLATSADQRATVLAGIYVAAATGIIAAITTNESITVNLALLIGASVTALLFLGGSLLCIWATIPVGFWVPGNDPGQWFEDIKNKVDVRSALGEQSRHYHEMIIDNRKVISANAKKFRIGAICGIIAPLVGILCAGITYLLAN